MTDGDVDSKKKFNDNVAINLEKAGEKMNQQFCTMLICIYILDSFCPEEIGIPIFVIAVAVIYTIIALLYYQEIM